jgi:hypothetical protein
MDRHGMYFININTMNFAEFFFIKIYFSNGKLAYEKKSNNTNPTQIDIASYPNGIYMINLTNSKNVTFMERLIKN